MMALKVNNHEISRHQQLIAMKFRSTGGKLSEISLALDQPRARLITAAFPWDPNHKPKPKQYLQTF